MLIAEGLKKSNVNINIIYHTGIYNLYLRFKTFKIKFNNKSHWLPKVYNLIDC